MLQIVNVGKIKFREAALTKVSQLEYGRAEIETPIGLNSQALQSTLGVYLLDKPQLPGTSPFTFLNHSSLIWGMGIIIGLTAGGQCKDARIK